MADPISALVVGGSTLASGIIGSNAASKASDQQAAAAQEALKWQRTVFDTNQANLDPFIKTGQNATYSLASLYGLPGANGRVGGAPDYSAFYNSPDYNFAFDQGKQATTNVLSAQGNLLSGGGLTALTNYGQGLASQQYGNYFNRLLSLATMGSQAGQSLAGVNTTAANTMGNTMQGIGQAQASGTVGAANAWTGALNSAAGNYTMSNYLKGMGGNQGNPSSYQSASAGPTWGNLFSPGTSGFPFANPFQSMG